MAIVCEACGAWVMPILNKEEQTARCPQCNYLEPRRFLPLFIVTGASGVGKTALVRPLRRLLPHWDVFETDILQDSGGDWDTVKCNWLRIAHNLAQSNRLVILCGTILPVNLEHCEMLPFFTTIHYLALHCESAVLAERLRARPAWRGWTEEWIAGHLEFARWLLHHADTAFDPPLEIVDATQGSPQAVAEQVCAWALARREHSSD